MAERGSVLPAGADRPKGRQIRLKLRHKVVRMFLGPPVWLFCRIKSRLKTFSFKKESGGMNPPCLVLSNHCSDLDPLWITLCFPFPIFWVASDHIFRKGLVSRLLRWLVSPIPKLKTQNDVHTVRDILSALRSGASVGIFPEGERSWSGETEEISPAIGKLVRRLNVPLVLCRIHGGYASHPRWGDSMRRGPVEVRLARILTPEQMGEMSVDELNEMIKKELHITAEEDQRELKGKYPCKNPAQSLETLLFACPACRRLGTLRSKGDRVFCDCGLSLRYGKDASLLGGPFRTLLHWDRWQKGLLRERLMELRRKSAAQPIFSDHSQRLYSFTRANRETLLDRGNLKLFIDRLVFEGERGAHSFPLSEILDMDIWGRTTLQLSLSGGEHLEVRSEHPRSAYKYLQAFKILKEGS